MMGCVLLLLEGWVFRGKPNQPQPRDARKRTG